MRNFAIGLIVALASTLAYAAGPTPAPPRMLPSASFALPPTNQHYNAFAFAASGDSTSTTPGTTNLYRVSGTCASPTPTSTAGFTLLQSGNPPSATTTNPVFDTTVKAGDVWSYVVTAVIGGKESGPSNCVTGATQTFPPASVSITSN